MNEIERELIEEIVNSVVKRHEESKAVGTVGCALAWLKEFERSLRKVVVRYEKRLIVIARPTLVVRSRPDSVTDSDPQRVA